jgi:putative nucleotidyltransferase with HDIG domain
VFFLSALFLLTWLYPDYRSFPYEYQKGRPWMYADLVSPMDYALLKSRTALEKEKEEVMAGSPLIFNHVSSDPVERMSIQEDMDSLVLKWMELVGKEELFILERWPEGIPERETFTLIEGGAGKTYLAEDLLILDRWPKGFWGPDDSLHSLFTDSEWVVLQEQIKPNLIFDEPLTVQIQKDRLSQLTPYEGKVKKGEGIAYEGLIVDELVLRKLDALRTAYMRTDDTGDRGRELTGVAILNGLLMLMLFLFLRRFRPHVLSDIAQLGFVLASWILMAAMARLTLSFGNSYLLLAPFTVLPVVLRAFFDTRIALFVHVLSIMSIGLLSSEGLSIVMLHFIAGFYAIISVDLLYKRAQLFLTLAKVVALYLLVYFAFLLFQDVPIREMPGKDFLFLGINGLLALSAFPLIYLSEKVFGLVSDLSLLELIDTNNPLLRELSEKAPGTFQHSLQVANLAEAAVLKIGGNTLMIRAAAMYHDIGKMRNPMFFIENQGGGVNPHDDLGYEESAQIIIDHVKEGVRLARKHDLPENLIDFIRTHHGSSRVHYFYRQHMKNMPNTDGAEDLFRYPGPKPFSKETAVLMMADAVEAASRSVAKNEPKALSDLVDAIVEQQMADGQFEEAEITLGEIGRVREELKNKLNEIYHFRIAYPD